MHKLLFLASIVLFTSVLAEDECRGRTFGTFCQGIHGIVECDAQGAMSGTSCATAHVNGRRIDGKCIETNDGRAYCRSPVPSPCDHGGPGTFCVDGRSLRTCLNDGSHSIHQCAGGHPRGRCVDNRDGKAFCRSGRL